VRQVATGMEMLAAKILVVECSTRMTGIFLLLRLEQPFVIAASLWSLSQS